MSAIAQRSMLCPALFTQQTSASFIHAVLRSCRLFIFFAVRISLYELLNISVIPSIVGEQVYCLFGLLITDAALHSLAPGSCAPVYRVCCVCI